MPGKARSATLIEHVFGRTGTDDHAVIQGPADGEDAAAISVPEGTLVVSADPISLAADAVGTLGVHVACNDVAVSGAEPRWLTVVALLAPDTDLESVTTDLDRAARAVGVSIVGGHTETVDALERPVLSVTAMGMADAFVPTGGAEPGDRILLTNAAGLEGSAILATDFGDDLAVDERTRRQGAAMLEEISVVPDARVLRPYATAMHDPTEGGVLAALLELARAAEVHLTIDRDAVPVRPATETLCSAAGVDPLCIFASGAVLATVPEDAETAALTALADAGIDGAAIGTVGSPATDQRPTVTLDGEVHTGDVEDDLYPLWAKADGASDEGT